MALLINFTGLFIALFAVLIMVQRRRFPSRYDPDQRWARARRRLTVRQQIAITRATNRRRPVEDAALRPAQLAFVGQAEEAARHSPAVTRKRARLWVALAFGGLAVWWATRAAAGGQARVWYAVAAALAMAAAVSWIVAACLNPPRSREDLDRLARLRLMLEDADDQHAQN
jgi:hypothetical protein